MPIRRLTLLVLLLATLTGPANATVMLSLYSRDFGESFPHAFFTVTGTTSDAPDTPVDANYGFTAKHLTPAVLTGSVLGAVEAVDETYVRRSLQHLSFPITDDQYRAVMGAVERWRDLPGKAYNLNSRNCVFFVGDIARTLGMTVVEDPALMKKPRSFLDDLRARNPGFEAAQIALTSGPAVSAPAEATALTAPAAPASPIVSNAEGALDAPPATTAPAALAASPALSGGASVH